MHVPDQQRLAAHHGHGHGHGHGHDHGHDHQGQQKSAGGPVIALLTEQRHLNDAALREARESLESEGCDVRIVAPERGDLFDIPDEAPLWDCILSRGRNLAALSILAAATNLGVLTINTPRLIELVRNKIAMQSLLVRHSMPVPRAWFASDPAVFRDVPHEYFPLIIKPFDGDSSAGLWMLFEPDDCELLPRTETERTLFIAQEYLATDGYDLKLYGIGSHVWAVRKPSPVTFPEAGPALMRPTEGSELIEMNSMLRDIALTCGRACGLELWGVDVAMTPNGPYVIEINDFPTYSSVPGAGELIARHVRTLIEIDQITRGAGQSNVHAIVRSSS